MKKAAIIILFSLIANITVAQVYEKQLGLRLGVTSGLSAKVIKDNRTAIEGVFGFRDGGIQIYVYLCVAGIVSPVNKDQQNPLDDVFWRGRPCWLCGWI